MKFFRLPFEFLINSWLEKWLLLLSFCWWRTWQITSVLHWLRHQRKLDMHDHGCDILGLYQEIYSLVVCVWYWNEAWLESWVQAIIKFITFYYFTPQSLRERDKLIDNRAWPSFSQERIEMQMKLGMLFLSHLLLKQYRNEYSLALDVDIKKRWCRKLLRDDEEYKSWSWLVWEQYLFVGGKETQAWLQSEEY